jgi:hypothetical protein
VGKMLSVFTLRISREKIISLVEYFPEHRLPPLMESEGSLDYLK